MSGAPPVNPDDILRRILEAGSNIKFGAGVVAKTTRAMLTLLAMWTVIAFRLGPNLTTDAALFGAGIVGSALFFWWTRATQSFAERNPGQAIMDGAQFLEYQKFEAQVKGGSIPGRSALIESGTSDLPRIESDANG